jgi:superfamily II DNA or RNA helicase
VITLRDYQQEAIDAAGRALAKHPTALVVAPTACHCASDKILLADGSIKTAKEVVIGDKLMGKDGTPRTVLETHSGFSDMYRVTSDKFDSYTVSKGHLLCLYRTAESAGQEPRYETLPVELWNDKAKWFKHIRYIYRAGIELDFGSTYSPEISAYVLGMIICDGSQKTLDVTKAYPEWIEYLQAEADKFGITVKAVWDEKRHAYNMAFSVPKGYGKNPMKDAIRDMMCGDMRRIPQHIRTAPAVVRKELLAGILDGDGSLGSSGLYELTFKQKELIEDVRFIALSLGLNVSQVQTKMVKLAGWDEPRAYYRINIGGDTHKIPCRIKKSSRPSSVTKNSTISRFQVEFVGCGWHYGWTVDCDNQYLLSDMQVIHNSGKSLIIAGIIQRAIAKDSSKRFLVLCSTKEILEQNENQVRAFCGPKVTTGIYCAGTGRKETSAQVICASRDSLGRDPLVCGRFDVVLLDEAHQAALALDDEDDETRYGCIIRTLSPRYTVGLTGTPWRLAGGNVWGKDNFFKSIAYNIPMRRLIADGFLSPYIFPPVETKIDTSNVKTSSTGDYVISDLEMAIGREVCENAIREWMRHAAQRRVSLFFCVSRAHGKLVAELLADKIGAGHVAYLDGETRKYDREAMVQHIKAGKYRAVVNIGTLTTGFDAPIIDCVVFLRPTKSASLFVQMSGRGLRRHPGKSNAMFLDMAGNFARFGSIETPKVLNTGIPKAKLDEEEPEGREGKPCPSCGYPLSMRPTACPFCGEVFVKLSNRPFTGSETDAAWYELSHFYVEDYLAKSGNYCKRINYRCKNGQLLQEYFVTGNPYAYRKFNDRMADLQKKPFALFGSVDGRLVKVQKFLTEEKK